MSFRLYQATAFLSAFLLFAVQPYVANTLLPAFGGSAVVWGCCMVLFQGLLFLGYSLSHSILSRTAVVSFAWAHLLLLIAAIASYHPLAIPMNFAQSGNPVWAIATLLGRHVAFPFLLLSFSTPLLQKALAQTALPEANDPYCLFSASNLGSLLALLSYPIIWQNYLTLDAQGRAWWVGLVTVSLLFLAIIVTSRFRNHLIDSISPEQTQSPLRYPLWAVVTLSAGGSALLLSVTNLVAISISSVPLLWVIPLSIYLVTFILTFKRRPWSLNTKTPLLPWWTALGLALCLLDRWQFSLGNIAALVAHYGVLFVGCLISHSTLAACRPQDTRGLTRYYTALSAGGVAGSLIVTWLIPVVSTHFIEYPASMAMILVGVFLATPGPAQPTAGRMMGALSGLIAAFYIVGFATAHILGPGALGITALTAFLFTVCLLRRGSLWLGGVAVSGLILIGLNALDSDSHTAGRRWRNVYGVYEINENEGRRYLLHGPTVHGYQYLDEEKSQIPLAYYHPGSPAGMLLSKPAPEPRSFGMIGLGTGALCAYAKPGETFTIFELDPLNVQLAESAFSYLKQARERGVAVTIAQGDGRLLTRRQPEASFDYLIIDAFSGGAIPVHLLTVEAFQDYARAVKPQGSVLLHLSNRLLNLAPIVAASARASGWQAYFQTSDGTSNGDRKPSLWALLSRNATPPLEWRAGEWETPRHPWTDQYSQILAALRWRESENGDF